jgi:polysaccharide deacetylase family protein (PEP-CTERM system associated)
MTHSFEHLLTFDVEHWYEGYRHRRLGGWEGLPPRDHVVVERLFELLERYGQTATFFFTGRFAREFPGVVEQCAKSGYEVASHSDEHRVIYRMASEIDFRADLDKSLDTLAGITGKPVLGYRAPKWSITEENQRWVFDALADAGLAYDSSFFPSPGVGDCRRLGLPLRIALSDGRSMIEVPATGFNLGPAVIPVAGGLYFRAFPAWVASAMLAQKERRGTSGMLYVHPYDLDREGPQIAGGSLLFRLFRAYGLAGAWKKLEQLLARHRFTSIGKRLSSLILTTELDLGAKRG